MKIGLDIKGFKEFEQKLAKLADAKLITDITADAFREGAKPILAAAKANIPVDTGKSQQQLRITVKRRKGKVIVRVGEGGKDDFFLAFVEYGHGIGKLDKPTRAAKQRLSRWKDRQALAAKLGIDLTANDSRRQVPARPFLRPAVDAKKAEAETIIARQIGAKLDALFK